MMNQMPGMQSPLVQNGQYTGPQAITPPPSGMNNPILAQAMQLAQPAGGQQGMDAQKKMMLAQMLQHIGQGGGSVPGFSLAGITGSTQPNSYVVG